MCCFLFLDSFSFSGKRTVAERINWAINWALNRNNFLPVIWVCSHLRLCFRWAVWNLVVSKSWGNTGKDTSSLHLVHGGICRDCAQYCFCRQTCCFPAVFLKAVKRLGEIHCTYKGWMYLRHSVSFGMSQGIWNSCMKLAGVAFDVLEAGTLQELKIGWDSSEGLKWH